jgi:hypothetical protein
MGRASAFSRLNVLSSFAPFDREIIGERICDQKLAIRAPNTRFVLIPKDLRFLAPSSFSGGMVILANGSLWAHGIVWTTSVLVFPGSPIGLPETTRSR